MTDLRELFNIARRRWFPVVALALTGALIAAAVNLIVPVTYVASARLFIATPTWNDSTAITEQTGGQKLSSYGDEFSQMRIATYQRLATSPGVTLPVIDKLQLDLTPNELANRITCRAVPDTVMLDLQVRDQSAAQSAAIANAAAEQLAEYIKQLEKPSYSAASPIQPVMIRPAAIPQKASSPRVLLNIASGAAIGLLVGLTLAFILENRVRSRVPAWKPESGAPVGDDGTLGVLEMVETDDGVDASQWATELDEDARFFRLRVSAAMADVGASTLLLTCPRTCEWVWRTAVKLASAFAEVGSSTVVVIADFELQLEDEETVPGLGDVLAGEANIDSVVRRDPSGRLSMVLPGTVPNSPTAAYADRAMATVVAALTSLFDHVLVAGPAVLDRSAAVDLAGKLDASVLVVPTQAGREDIEDSERLMRTARTPYLGRVISVGAAAALGAAVIVSEKDLGV